MISHARPIARTNDRYDAKVQVPGGGIGGIRIGLRGSTETLFPIENDPFTTPRGVRCDVAALRTTLATFVRAYNRGDVRKLDRMFSRKRFHWYASSGPGMRQPPDAQDRETLISYFRERHTLGDHLILRTYRFNSYERARNLGHFEFQGKRRADDFRDGAWFRMVGKGALDCSQRPITIGVMFVGGPER